MGATNTTANYNLSQFIGTDKPAWLQDYNGDMLKIDTGINAAKVAADGAQNTADSAQNTADSASSAITNTINPAITSLNTTVGNQGGAINTINSLIGNGTPTTTDQTIIGAINEINAKLFEWNPKGVEHSGSGTEDITGLVYDELLLVGKYGTMAVSVNIPKAVITNGATTFKCGSGGSNSWSFTFQISSNTVSLIECHNGSTDMKSDADTKYRVYYR